MIPSADAASSGTCGSRRVQMTSFAAGRRLRVTPSETMKASQKIGAPASSAARAAETIPGETFTSRSSPTSPAAWIMRTTTCSSSRAKRASSASARMVAKLSL